MAGRGVQYLTLRVPEQWSAEWFKKVFILEVLAKLDIRNAIEGGGISVTGNSDENATITSDADVAALQTLPYVLTSASGTVPNERVLAGESGVITILLGSPGGNVTVGIADGGVPVGKLAPFPAVSVLVRAAADDGYPFPIVATADGQVLKRAGGVLTWGGITSQGYTVATLPAVAVAGDRAHVTDAVLPTFLGVLTGGGAVVTPVFHNGSAWVAG